MRVLAGLVGMLSLLLVAALPAPASAHELQVDGNISAVMHTDPDDDPVSDAPTSYVLFFNDTTNKFSLPKCTCNVTITEQNRILSVSPLITKSDGIGDGTFTFPRPDIYTVAFSGTPKTPGTFQPFMLKYEIRVADGQSSTQSFPTLLWAGIGTVMALILLTAYIINK